MRLGFLTPPTDEWIAFAAREGFKVLELLARPGSPLDPLSIKAGEVRALCDKLGEHGLAVSSLLVPARHMDGEAKHRREAKTLMNAAIRLAGKMGVPHVTTVALADDTKTVDQNLPAFQRVFGGYAKVCRDHGVRIAIENWPCVRQDPIRVVSVAYSPEAYAKLFDAVPDAEIGMEYDPSHFHWLGADPIQVIEEFADRIYVAHAKDTEVHEDVLHRVTIYGSGWWRYRIPGWGDLDWQPIFRALADVGYDGDVIIEHEDPVFSGPRRGDGFVLAKKFLDPFMTA